MAKNDVSFTVNGQPVVVASEHLGWTLLRYVREILGLTGAKRACDDEGTCGSCTVIVDNQAVLACQLRVGDLAGCAVQTIEGLSADGTLHPLQQTFVLQRVMQCGFCTPGQIMAAKALLDANPSPSDEQIKEALRGNICRCSGGFRAVRAVQQAAAILRGEATIGWTDETAAAERVAITKATGAIKYTDDLTFEGMLYAQARRSDYAHARIKGIDVSHLPGLPAPVGAAPWPAWRSHLCRADRCRQAGAVPGVVAVLTSKDVPGRNAYGLLTPDQPVLCDEVVRMVGDALALVVAETPEAASAAVEKIRVDYEPLPVLTTPQAALAPDAPQLHPGGNVLRHVKIRKGDVAEGFAQADVIVEGDYYTPFSEHGFLDLECSIGLPEGDGVVVHCGSQGPPFDREQVAAALGLPQEKVRIAHLPVGGAYGGKEDVSAQVLAALAAYLVQRPVKVRFSRAESLRAHHKRHAQFMHYKTGATRDGRVVAVEATFYGDTGAYASTGEAVMFRSATFAAGPYEVPHVKVDAYAVHTNNITCGAFRGFGSPQPTFAAELQMEKMARALGIDSFTFREINALTLGKMTITGQVLSADVGDGIRQCLGAVRRAMAVTPRPNLGPHVKIGVGVAGSYKNVGLGGGIPDEAGARISLQKEGTFLLQTGAVDLGQGASEAMAVIAAETLGVERGRIHLLMGDTHRDPPGGMTTASRQTFVSGNAALHASQRLRRQMWDYVSEEFHLDPAQLVLHAGCFTDANSGQTLISLADLGNRQAFVAEAYYAAPATNSVPEWAAPVPTDEELKLKLHFAYSFGAQGAMVAVDEISGQVRVLKVVAAHDAGRAISRSGVETQIEGGVVQGMGYALSERFHMKEGQLGVTTFEGLGLPVTPDVPDIEPIIIEEPHPDGPLGAKGMGELPLTATAPAIVNAIYDAVGVWINELPATPEKVLAAIQAKRSDGGEP
jgi:CO/xanthine dehydrogenase Mo-binding subunit/aerobic-type carbon monoxide dehydrogenase small subunit (CoxS/CutS family)